MRVFKEVMSTTHAMKNGMVFQRNVVSRRRNWKSRIVETKVAAGQLELVVCWGRKSWPLGSASAVDTIPPSLAKRLPQTIGSRNTCPMIGIK